MIHMLNKYVLLKHVFHYNFRTLRDLNLDVIELAPDESYPNCPFLESCAFICNGMALITRPCLERLEEV